MKHLGKPITQRQLRVGEMIKQALGTLFIRDEAKIPNLSTKEITVTEVRMSPDLKTAKIFVMPLGGKKKIKLIDLRYLVEVTFNFYFIGVAFKNLFLK
jgi:ribosome-binding factor A